jgi:hypothetical protein
VLMALTQYLRLAEWDVHGTCGGQYFLSDRVAEPLSISVCCTWAKTSVTMIESIH